MRLSNWETRLASYLARAEVLPVEYGKHDCCLFGASVVEALTGVDPMPEFRGRYRSAAGASRVLRQIGAGSLEATLDSKFKRVKPAFAQRGDLVFFDGSLGVAMGGFAFFLSEEGGFSRIQRQQWQICWKVI